MIQSLVITSQWISKSFSPSNLIRAPCWTWLLRRTKYAVSKLTLTQRCSLIFMKFQHCCRYGQLCCPNVERPFDFVARTYRWPKRHGRLVDFQPSRPSWIGLCCQCVRGFTVCFGGAVWRRTVRSRYRYRHEEVTTPCNPNPCRTNQVCSINRDQCVESPTCSPYICTPGKWPLTFNDLTLNPHVRSDHWAIMRSFCLTILIKFNQLFAAILREQSRAGQSRAELSCWTEQRLVWSTSLSMSTGVFYIRPLILLIRP